MNFPDLSLYLHFLHNLYVLKHIHKTNKSPKIEAAIDSKTLLNNTTNSWELLGLGNMNGIDNIIILKVHSAIFTGLQTNKDTELLIEK